MTVAKKKRSIVVGIAYDEGNAKQLLRCTLEKIADHGDSVFVFHVCRSSGSVSKGKALLDGLLEEYRSLCEKKQVVVKAEILIGNSYRKVLVREANKVLASTVIVGITKHSVVRGWASVAEYCIKRLPQTTDIVAIYDGKMVYRSKKNETGVEYAGQCKENGYNPDRKPHDLQPKAILGWSKRRSLSCVSLPQEDFSQETPGWPLLRASSLVPVVQDARNMSVVQWAMSLPRRSLSSPNYRSEDLKMTLMKKGFYCRVFSYNLLKKATSYFTTGNLIAKGGCNSVYKGVLPDGKKIAVRIRLSSSEETQRDFIREVDIMSAVNHKKIIPFLGICLETDHLISVYEFSPRGNLEQNLQGKLPWKARFKIAHGVAQVLDYLHTATPRSIIHRDIKSSNILLTEELEPQLSDFELAIWGPKSATFVTDDDVVGTFGYLAPEYLMYGKVSEKVDVYSYGVVLLELLSGKKPISCGATRSRESLVLWARDKLESGDLKGMLDPKLGGKVDDDQVRKLALAAKLCLVQSARLRPPMNQIVRVLEGRGEAKDNDAWRSSTEDAVDDDHDEMYPDSSVESHMSVAFVDVNEKESGSCSSNNSPVCVEEYLKKRWSRCSSLGDLFLHC